jgi:hypothetical protein
LLDTDLSALPVSCMAIPSEANARSVAECLPYTAFTTITSKQIMVDAESILTQHKHAELELLTRRMLDVSKELLNDPSMELDWSRLRDLEFQEHYREKVALLKQIPQFVCSKCPDILVHVKHY